MNNESDLNIVTKNIISDYTNNEKEIFSNSPDFINKIRQQSFSSFKNIGFPTTKNENYKYTNIEKSFFGNYKKEFKYEPLSIDVHEVFSCDIPELKNYILLVNGWFYDKNKILNKSENGVIIGSLIEAAKQYPELVKKYLAKSINPSTDTLALLTSAFLQDGLFVYVPDNVTVSEPIQLINLIVANEDIIVNPYNLIIAGKNSSVDIVVCDHSLNPNAFLLNSTSEIYASENSKIQFYRQQNAHDQSVQLSNNFINQKENSFVNSVNITLHGGTVRNNLMVNLNGKGACNNSYALWLADEHQHIDSNTFIKHSAEECQSYQLYKGIMDNKSTGIFSGKILVEKNAQKTSAFQSNKNLLLTNEAKALSKPQLEIYADDVKCSHGSATGQLDEDSMFYLRSRGISKKESCQLLMQAFADEVTSKILIEPLRNEINELVEKRLRGELSRCNKCKVNCCK